MLVECVSKECDAKRPEKKDVAQGGVFMNEDSRT